MPTRLAADFVSRSTRQVARSLLGKLLVRRLSDGGRLSGIVVEVEAYLASGDEASHSYSGPGKKNASMFLDPGTLYVYPIHSRHCLNVVTEQPGRGAAVLIRALEPVEGLEQMAFHRGLDQDAMRDLCQGDLKSAVRLTTGPARLCQALAVDRGLDGVDLLSCQDIWIESEPDPTSHRQWKTRASKRIGISRATEMPLRWFVDGNRFVSGCARDHSAGRTWRFLSC